VVGGDGVAGGGLPQVDQQRCGGLELAGGDGGAAAAAISGDRLDRGAGVVQVQLAIQLWGLH